VFRTTDNGQTWAEVAPVAPKGLALWGDDFLNAADTWLLYKSPQPVPSDVMVLATTDGGQRWAQVGELPAGCYRGVGALFSRLDLDFVDTEHGWCGVSSSVTSSPTAMYRTSDGGRSWQGLDGPRSLTKVPAASPSLSHVVAITGGYSTEFALLSDGTVRGWGDDEDGEMGNGPDSYAALPVQVPGLHRAVAIAGGVAEEFAVVAPKR
jgi:hypothetical protein